MNNICDEKLKQEEEILQQIYDCIKKQQCFIFNAGAGAGKTYSLIKALKYSIDIYGYLFNRYNQKIMCITYTNVAKDEVKERLGKTNIVEVSTIHQKLWNIIKDYQNQLLEMHKEKLENCIEELDLEIKKSKVCKDFSEIEFENFRITCEKAEDTVYKNYNKNAENFRKNVKEFFINYENALKNVGDLKKIVNNFKNIRNYKKALADLNDKNNNISIEYDARIPDDRLDEFKISHDTLIEYSNKIIEKNDLIKRIIIDKYPMIFIDEYQDTLVDVINILKELKDYSKIIERSFIIGYFGDTAQNIYDNGVGEIIDKNDYKLVKKDFNRRSRTQIIDICNNIRNDDLKQETIYNNFNDGNVEFYFKNKEKFENFEEVLQYYKNKYNISKDNPVHCLILKNAMIAEKSGFKEVFDFFNKSNYYQRNYNILGEELLSNDIEKLGRVSKMLYEILKLKNEMKNENSLLKDFYKSNQLKEIKELPLKEIRKLNIIISNIEIYNLQNYLEILFKYKTNSESILFEYAVNNLFEDILGVKSIEELKVKITQNLRLEDNREYINTLFQMDINILDNWYNYISQNYTGDEIYHTIHSTKGLEFDNVLILLQDDFAKKNDYFKEYFKNMNEKDLGIDLKKRKNLFYVAYSRAKKNLVIFYDVVFEDDFERKIKKFLKLN